MKLPDLLAQLLLNRGDALSPTQVLPPPEETLPYAPGQRLPAQVLAPVAPDRFLVAVGARRYEMPLPGGLRAGDKLELVYLGSGQGGPRFLLAKPAASGHEAVALSGDGKFISALRQATQPPAADAPSMEPASVRSVPLLSAGELPPAVRLAQVLTQAIEQSGLFYESHVAGWAAGERPLASLLQEPQGRSSPLLQAPADHSSESRRPGEQGRADSAAGAHPAARDRAGTGAVASQLEHDVRRAYQEPPPADAAEPASLQIRHADLVQQQLHSLESRQVNWAGQIWPGQHLEWQIEERPAAAPGGVEGRVWFTTLKLELPGLGRISVQIQLLDRQVQLRIQAAEAALPRLRADESLRDGLRNAGLALQGMVLDVADGSR
ncbi:flagellar hook-length control protein FliK [Thermithiobacillus tepidarius DSM 3134]|uniref:flagellar hook-length control protein FliK n=1 Tax=Thermithiobacillus tepidarius TaxID=929 RepID=UPI000406A8F9|nr:flagellar hook-length control protein FliK [Thermithiobacillus tepidarius]